MVRARVVTYSLTTPRMLQTFRMPCSGYLLMDEDSPKSGIEAFFDSPSYSDAPPKSYPKQQSVFTSEREAAEQNRHMQVSVADATMALSALLSV